MTTELELDALYNNDNKKPTTTSCWIGVDGCAAVVLLIHMAGPGNEIERKRKSQ